MWGRKKKDRVLTPGQVESSALRMLSKRDYPVEELRGKLLDRGGQKVDVDELIARYSSYGYLDDERIARRQTLLLADRYGPVKVRHKLTSKGLDRELVDTYLDQVPDEKWVSVALRRVRRRFGEPSELDLKERQRVYRHLASRGYPSQMIREALNASPEDDFE